MIQTIWKASLLLIGYLILGVGVLSLIAVFKFMLDIFPEILVAQVFGFLITVFGFWVLGKYDKIYETRQPWRR